MERWLQAFYFPCLVEGWNTGTRGGRSPLLSSGSSGYHRQEPAYGAASGWNSEYRRRANSSCIVKGGLPRADLDLGHQL